MPDSLRLVLRRLATLSLAPLLAAIILAGCGAGDVIDPNKTEIAVRFDVREATGEPIKSVSCPSDVPVSIGTRFVCEVEAVSGARALAELEIVSEDGDMRMYGLTAP